MKKLIIAFLSLILCFSYMPHTSEAKGFGGSRGFSIPHTKTYSGYRAPSRMKTPGTFNRGSSIMSHAASFGMGMLIGRMFHPFGGYYGGGTYGFSFLGILLDIVVILLVIGLLKRIFSGRRY
ncbi:MAG: hypothetical protein ACO1OC_11630 [Tuberibacillus sp.]